MSRPGTGSGSRARRVAAMLGAVVASSVAAVPAMAINDLSGAPVANTGTVGLEDQLSSRSLLRHLATPFSAPRPVDVGSPNTPEEDLHAALTALAGAATAPEAEDARARVIAILTGGAVAGASYEGIPLLNDGAAMTAKTKVVAPGGNVVVRLVRFGEHQISDTWQLQFIDPNQPFTITYRISEVGGAEGGDLTPTPLLRDGATPIGGLHSVVSPLVRDETLFGTNQASRFTTARSLGAQAEHTRLATQDLTVRMPPPRNLSVVLDPNLRPGHEALSVLKPLGGATAIARAQLAQISPERQIFDALQAPFASVGAANAAGTAALPHVATMRVKSHLPPGVSPVPGTDVTVAFMNNEMYVSRLSVRKAPGQPVTVGVRNADEVQHTVQTIALHGRQQVHGATDWGQFGWNVLGTTSVAAATFGPTVLGTQTVAVTPAGDAFQLIVGDPNSGDQAHVAITLDRRPDQQSFRVPGPAFAFPLHQAVDAQGNIWVTIAGGDKIARLTPAANLAASQYVEFHLPPPPPFAIAWEPVDIDVDSQGIVYATLAAGNAILRFDPSQGSPGTSNGMSIVDLLPCPETECRPPPPPAVEAVLSREPTQMALKETPAGTEVWFTEALADKIGVVRWGPGGTNPLQSHFTCACKVTSPTNPAVSAGTPSGMAIDANGHVWFAGANRNTIARLIPPADPFTTTIANIRHFNIPTGTLIDEPEIGGAFVTAAPHSVALDPAGRVWFTELAQHRVGYLEPWKAVENTTQGMREIDLGKNDFGAFNQPADLTSDPAGTIYTVDEYGDEVNVVTRCGVVNSWRPTERLSFTDQPLVDKQGNLWFLEAGANLITRIAGVAALPGAPDSGAGCDNPPPGGGTPPGGGPTGTPAAAETVACGKRQWAYGTRTAPKVLLLGRTPAQVTKCLGRPTVRRGATWRYGNRILVTFRSGKVRSFTLLNGVFRSKVGNVGVGSRALVLRRISSARVAYNVRTRTYTTFLPVSSRARAQVRYTMRSGRVSRVIVTQVPR